MVRRLLVGLIVGFVVGGALAAGLVALKQATFSGVGGAALAYLAAALAGVLTGVVAGRPIWAPGAKIEAGLKAAFGALIAAGGMFALRQWGGGLPWVDLRFVGAGGPAPAGELAAASLPLIAAVLGGLFELDNTGDGAASATAGRKRVSGVGATRDKKGRVVELDETDADVDGELVSKRAKP